MMFRNLGVCCGLMAPLYVQALVRYGPVVNTGNMIVKYAPEALQDLDASVNQKSWYEVDVNSYTSFSSLERFTLVNQIRSHWRAEGSLSKAEQYSIKNNLYLGITTSLDIGVGLDWQYLDDGVYPVFSGGNGHQYTFSARWQW